MSKKKGSCFQGAAHCCKILLPHCPYLKNGRCAVYDKQPLFCKIFPIDEKDKELNDVRELCSYYFQ